MFDVFPMMYSYVADHFAYLSTPVIFLMFISGGIIAGDRLRARCQWARGKTARCLFIAGAIFCLVSLGIKTRALQANYKDSVTLWKSVIAKNPGCSTAYNNLAAHIGVMEPEAAIVLLEKAIAIDPQYVNALNNIGTLYLRIGKPATAIPYFEKALGIEPLSPKILHNLGIAQLDLKKYDEGIDSLARAIKLDPSQKISIIKIVNAINEKRAGQVGERSRPGTANGDICNQAGAIVGERGDYKSALTLFSEAIVRDPGNSEAYNNMGYTCYLMDDYKNAVICFQRAISINPDYTIARRNLMRVHTIMAEKPGASGIDGVQ